MAEEEDQARNRWTAPKNAGSATPWESSRSSKKNECRIIRIEDTRRHPKKTHTWLLSSLLFLVLVGVCRSSEINVEAVVDSVVVVDDHAPPTELDNDHLETMEEGVEGKEDPKCGWGKSCQHHGETGLGEDNHEPSLRNSSAESSEKNNKHILSFVSSSSSSSKNKNNNHHDATERPSPPHHHHHHGPPEGFTITARVYTDPNDKLAHFTDDEVDQQIKLPYWECGATGSITSPIPIKNAYFRHAFNGAQPNLWSGTEYGPHPQLLVALKSVEISLNSGESKVLRAGDVVLLEDIVSGGHKVKSSGKDDMNFLLLTLPQQYHHVGKDRLSLKMALAPKPASPCPNEVGDSKNKGDEGMGATVETTKSILRKIRPKSTLWTEDNRIRTVLLGTVGMGLSGLMVDKFVRVAPLWLAVGIGGTVFVLSGTYGFVKAGDFFWSEIDIWLERRRLSGPPEDQADVDVASP